MKRAIIYLQTQALHQSHNAIEQKSTGDSYHKTASPFWDSYSAPEIFEIRDPGFIYIRKDDPTTNVLEQRLAAYEGGVSAVATSCGQSAVSTALLTLLRSGDHIVAGSSLYVGTFNLLTSQLPKYGIDTTFIDVTYPEQIEAAITENTKLIYCDCLDNPMIDVPNIRAVAKVAHTHGLPLFVDNTQLSGIYHPIEDGADVVLYSLSQNICGDCSTPGGAIIDSGHYDWGSGRHPELSEPCESYHGICFSEAYGPFAYVAALRAIGLQHFGTCINPYCSNKLIGGLSTLDARIRRISETALQLAQWLSSHPLVEWVRYTGLASHKRHILDEQRYHGLHGGILTFGPKGGYDVAREVAKNTKIFSLVANFGDTKSLIVHPSSTTHNKMPPDEQMKAGIRPDLIRLGIGLEHIQALENDLDQALKSAQQ